MQSISTTSSISIAVSDKAKAPDIQNITLESNDKNKLDEKGSFYASFDYEIGLFYCDTYNLSRLEKIDSFKSVLKPDSSFQFPNQNSGHFIING